MTTERKIREVAKLRLMVSTGSVSLQVLDAVVTRAEKDLAISGDEVHLVMTTVGLLDSQWPRSDRPPKGLNIIEKARHWIGILKKDLDRMKRILANLEKTLSKEDNIRVYMVFGPTVDREALRNRLGDEWRDPWPW